MKMQMKTNGMKWIMLLGAAVAVCAAYGDATRRNEGLVDFGVAYYPEAWPESRWETDLAMMKDLGMNLIRIGEFNWSNFEPTEGVFDFKPYLRLLDLCEKHGIKVMMCTPTAATPKWMQADYPETEKTRADGTKPDCGIRQSSCATGERFRFFSRRIVTEMARAFKDHPAVTTWQIDNELSTMGATQFCYCDICQAAYREDLKRRFGTLENLNKAFNGCFWSGTFTKWEDVRLPISRARVGWLADYMRFQGERFLAYALEQADILRKANPKWRLTSNNPSSSNFIRHDRLYGALGYAAADTYCTKPTDGSYRDASWTWAMFRGLAGSQKPFMIGETGPFCFDATLDNSYDLVKPWFWLQVGHGAESVMYFRWRQSVLGEAEHGAVLPWSGRKTFVYERLKKQMEEYGALPESIARLPLDRNAVAIVHDAASHIWTLSRAVSYGCADMTADTEMNLLSALQRRGVDADIVEMADGMDLSQYRVVFYPLCHSMSPVQQKLLREYVAGGGAAVAVSRMNFMSPEGGAFYPEVGPVGLTDFFGIEIDDRRFIPDGNLEAARAVDAQVLLVHEHNCFKGFPLLTRKANGKGAAYYFTRTADVDCARQLVAAVLSREGVAMREELPVRVVRMTRGPYAIVVNYTDEAQTLAAETGKLLMGEPEVAGGRMTLKPFDVVIFRK